MRLFGGTIGSTDSLSADEVGVTPSSPSNDGGFTGGGGGSFGGGGAGGTW
ncbi:MAG: hypothetical protein HOO91_07550 [Bacteroidales bacterium]|nr:hypothetical protein [Bacteroidales bacterium]